LDSFDIWTGKAVKYAILAARAWECIAMKILAVDDDRVARTILTALLKKMGHEVIEAEDGQEGWDLMNTLEFGVLIVDWEMPIMDGLELTRKVREIEREKYIYILMLTARMGKQNFIDGINAGADDFASKPVSPPELEARLRVAERILGLQADVRKLEGLLPICSYCKKIRGQNDIWQQIESYLAQRSDAEFSHGICPDCYESKVVPQLEDL
jgi:sigma-B regulation protein RsbU (phosphoserine phosphatase)